MMRRESRDEAGGFAIPLVLNSLTKEKTSIALKYRISSAAKKKYWRSDRPVRVDRKSERGSGRSVYLFDFLNPSGSSLSLRGAGRGAACGRVPGTIGGGTTVGRESRRGASPSAAAEDWFSALMTMRMSSGVTWPSPSTSKSLLASPSDGGLI